MLVDCLVTPSTQSKGALLVHAVCAGAIDAGLDARIVTNGKTRKDAWVVLYGLGGSDRIEHAGKPKVISLDAGYWDRKLDLPQRKYRVSIGGFHCPDRIFRGPYPGPERWDSAGLSIAESGGDPKGPILLVGNGPKSNRIGAANWCAEKSLLLRGMFHQNIWYRPKPKRAHDQCVSYDAVADGKDLDKILSQCSLVVCRHSNVAIDATRLGVPVACEDGAAKAIYRWADWEISDSQYLGNGAITGGVPFPLRTEFLHRLAWWQWSIAEIRAGMFWPWMLKQIDAN